MFFAPSSSTAVDPYLQTLLLRVSLSKLGGKHRQAPTGRAREGTAQLVRTAPVTLAPNKAEVTDAAPSHEGSTTVTTAPTRAAFTKPPVLADIEIIDVDMGTTEDDV